MIKDKKPAAGEDKGGQFPFAVRASRIQLSFGSTPVLSGVDIEAKPGTITCLLGPSGSGKSTLLRCIAGLEAPQVGQIEIHNHTVFDSETNTNVPAEKRNIGMVFQTYAVWPHMTVWENVAFPLKIRGETKAQISKSVNDILGLVGLEALGERRASQLSGGQQQRVALARALVARPKLVLFDEPLSNLDAKLRDRMRLEILRLQSELHFTAIYVTHDRHEALTLADNLVVMRDGKILQAGKPEEIYHHPSTGFVASFISDANVLTGTVLSATADDRVKVRLGASDILVDCTATHQFVAGDRVVVAFRPDSVHFNVAAVSASAYNRIPTRREHVRFAGDWYESVLRIDGQEIRVRSEGGPRLDASGGLNAMIAVSDCSAMPAEEGVSA